MRVIQQSFALLAICSVLFFTACDQQDNCTAPALEENIKGTWSATWENNATVEFKADGTFSDPSEALISGEINGVQLTAKTYEIRTGDELYLKAADPNNSAISVTATLSVSKNECNTIGIELLGVTADLTRQ